MAASFEFWTFPAHDKLEVFSATTEETYHEKAYGFDWNPDTYWAPTSTANNDLILDLGAAYQLDAWAIWLKDNKTTPGANTLVTPYHSATGTGGAWTAWSGGSLVLSTAWASGTPIIIKVPSASATFQYWKFSITAADRVLKISQLMLARKRTLAKGNRYPEPDTKRYEIRIRNSHGGRRLVRPINRLPISRYPRTWLLGDNGDADMAILDAVYDDCAGQGRPLIMRQDSGAYELVDLVGGELNQQKSQHQIYGPTLVFDTVPYIEDGEAL